MFEFCNEIAGKMFLYKFQLFVDMFLYFHAFLEFAMPV